jgi:hypothetical protein
MSVFTNTKPVNRPHYVLDGHPFFIDLGDEEYLSPCVASFATVTVTFTLTESESFIHALNQDPELVDFETVEYCVSIPAPTPPPPPPPRQATASDLPTYPQALSGLDGSYVDGEFPSLDENLAIRGDFSENVITQPMEVRTSQVDTGGGISALPRVVEEELPPDSKACVRRGPTLGLAGGMVRRSCA